MSEAKLNDTVKVHYTGSLDDGTVFDTSRNRDPLMFRIGSGEVIPGFEKAIIGMKVGDTKKVTIPSDEAYGPYRDEWVMEIKRAEFASDVEPEVGQIFELRQQNGHSIIVKVIKVNNETITLDANHPLAGENLTFDIELMEIV